MNLHPIVANGYFADISNNFNSWGFNTTAVWMLGILFCCILMFVILNYFLNLIKRSNSQESIFNITNSNEILATFNLALKHRSKFELKLSWDSSEIAVCSLLDILEDSMILELPADIHPTSSWEERPVYIYFGVPLEKNHRSHYFFSAYIKEILHPYSEFSQLKISLPQKLQQKQKRTHLRFDPTSDQIEKFIIWNAKDTNFPETIYKISYLDSTFPRIEQSDSNQFGLKLLNISGGGLMFSIPKQVAKNYEFDLEKNKQLFIYLQLPEPDTNKSTRVYLFAKIKNTYPDITGKRQHLGLQYLYVGTYTHEDPMALQWIGVDPAMGVEVISNWVFKQHLKLYREKGIA